MTIKSMDRMFLPVGQGAFYCERFKSPDSARTMNFVYDCGVLLRDHGGSKVKLQWLENVIDTVFRNGDPYPVLFLGMGGEAQEKDGNDCGKGSCQVSQFHCHFLYPLIKTRRKEKSTIRMQCFYVQM